jgi:predicted ATPase
MASAGASEIAEIMPEVRRTFPDLPARVAVESEAARFRLFDAIANFLRRASANRPIVLVLDDLHAADAPSLLLLQYLARGLGSSRMVVVGACRDVDPVPGASLTAVLADLAREPVTRRVRLHGLSEPDIEELVELTASELASPELAGALHARTEGNPLFVAETIRLLTAEGGPGTKAKRTIAVPETVRDVIARRLTHLSVDCNAMLGVASVLGRDFALAPLARLSGTEEDGVLEQLESAVAARIITEVGDALGRFRFAHVLIRDALYDDLMPARRVRLHRQAAGVLEELLGDEPGPHLAELARHAIAGRDFVRAFDYSRRAGDHALHVLAYEEAARHYESALEALELAGADDGATRCHVLLALGEAQSRAGSTDAAKASFLRAAESARKLRLVRELGRAATGYGGRVVFARAGSDMRLVPLLEEALAELGEEDLGLRTRLLARLAGALRDEHGRDRRDALSREAVAAARRSDDHEALADAINGRASRRSALASRGSASRARSRSRSTRGGRSRLERAACRSRGALLASARGMEFRILGPLEVCGETGTLPLGGAKQRALLAILLVHANEVVSAERLLDDLWGERQPKSGAKALHVYVSQLRKVVGEGRIVTRQPGYMLRLGQDELDVARHLPLLRGGAVSSRSRAARSTTSGGVMKRT